METPRLHEQFGYAYDAAWNLQRRTNNALVQTFGVNNLNELTNVKLRSGRAVAQISNLLCLRAETAVTVRWIAERLRMGAPGYVHHLLNRQRKAEGE